MTTETYKEICAYLRGLVEGTLWEGHIYSVGGCCRDEVMGHEITDVDLAVDLPDGGVKFAEWLSSRDLCQGVPVYFLRFGTAAFELKKFPGYELQVVQTRSEKYTNHNSRCPETAFGTLEEDCRRRDLTINSLYYDISRDKLIDITGEGVNHIRQHILRTPSDPKITFDDDPVRILRVIRFAARYGWKLPADIMEAMIENSSRLKIISPGRLQGEFTKLLTGPRPGDALRLLRASRALYQILPQLGALTRLKEDLEINGESPTIWAHTVATVEALQSNDTALRMAALLYEIGKIRTRMKHLDGSIHYGQYDTLSAKATRQFMRSLRYDVAIVKETVFLVTFHTFMSTWGEEGENMKDKNLRRLQMLCGSKERFDKLMLLIDAVNEASGLGHKQVQKALKRTKEMIKRGSDMFSFVLPLTDEEIAKASGARSDKAVSRVRLHLMKMACLNPLRPISEFMALARKKA